MNRMPHRTKEFGMKPIYKEKYPHLFEPMYVGKNKVMFNNRVRVAPIGTGATGGRWPDLPPAFG